MDWTIPISYCDKVKRHYLDCWGASAEAIKFDKGPIHELPAEFRALRFAPSLKRRMWTYATQCMSQPEDAAPLELHIFAPGKDDELVELLVAVAHYHRTGSRLSLGDTVNFGRPWLPGSLCDHGLISLPYLDGPDLEWMTVDRIKTRFLWLLPVTAGEVQFARKSGLEALEMRFQAIGLNYLDPKREPVV